MRSLRFVGRIRRAVCRDVVDRSHTSASDPVADEGANEQGHSQHQEEVLAVAGKEFDFQASVHRYLNDVRRMLGGIVCTMNGEHAKESAAGRVNVGSLVGLCSGSREGRGRQQPAHPWCFRENLAALVHDAHVDLGALAGLPFFRHFSAEGYPCRRVD